MIPPVDSSSFTLRQCLGTGGFGEVYLAEQEGGGEVALKVLHQGLDPRSQAVQRLHDEARLLALLDHPSILSIHDLILLDGRVALVTEYIDGLDLEDLLVRRPGIDLPAGLEVLGHVASALQSAFTTIGPKGKPLGLLHRDIKPGNIRVGRDGSVKLLDFGIAKATGVTREAKTKTSGVLGSFAYMAPERFDPKQVDTPAGDVCSLGAVLFELLTDGEMLFGDYDIKDLFGLALMPERREEALKERLALLKDVPPALVEVLREMLAYDAADRPALADLPDRLDTLAGEVSGQRLRPWASSYAWPAAPHLPGGLTGRSLTGDSLGTGMISTPRPEPLEGKAGETFVPPVSNTVSGPTLSIHDLQPPEIAREPVLTSAVIDVDDDLDAFPVRRGPRWGLIALASVVVLVIGLIGGVAGAAGIGVLLAGSTDADPVEDPQPDGPAPDGPAPDGPAPVDPDPTPAPDGPAPVVPVPDPVPDGPAPVDPVPDPVADAVPDLPEPVEDPQPGVPDPVEPVPDPEPDGPAIADAVEPSPDPAPVAGGIDACGRLVDVELNAALGEVPAPTRKCLEEQMRNAGLKQTDRGKIGRVLLNDAAAACETVGQCARYEALQLEYFDEIGRSDANMLTRWASHLLRTANNRSARLQQVDVWATRALERKDQWSGAERKQRVLQLHQLRAKASYQRFTLDASKANGEHAFQRAAEWAETLQQYNLDATEAMELCASAGGSRERCGKRVTSEAVTEDIRFLSIPVGASVSIDGKAAGDTPVTVPLTHGRHTVSMSVDGGTSEYAIEVGGGEAKQWQWRKSEDAWQAAY